MPIAVSSTGFAVLCGIGVARSNCRPSETFAAAPAKPFGEKSVEFALVGAIDKLPPDQRDAIRMLKLKEMSLKEASRASGRSVTALKVATHRAIKNLR